MAKDKHIRLFWISLMLVLGTVLAFFVFQPFLAEIFLAVVLAVAAYPLYRYVRKVVPTDSIASFATTIIVLLLIVVPVSLLGTFLVKEVVSVGGSISESGHSFTSSVGKIDGLLAEKYSFYTPGTVSLESVTAYLEQGMVWLAHNLQGLFSNILEWFISTAIMLMALYYLFKEGDKVYEGVLYISPLDDETDKKIGHEIASIMRAVISGRIVVALAQGLAAYAGFLFFGIGNSLLLSALVAVIAVLPLVGPLFIIVPVAVYQFAVLGATLPAVGLILWGIFIVGLVDNIIGPILIHNKTNLHPFAVLVSILGGLHIFGPVGFVAGPVVLGVVYALFKVLPLIYEDAKPKKRRARKKTAS